MKQKLLLFVFAAFFAANTFAQQDPQYTQYMYNMSIVNPAYTTGTENILSFGALYRAQWVGAEGGPETFTGFVHMPVSDNIEVGLSLVHDEIGGIVKENVVTGDFAYRLNFANDLHLSFGLKAGVSLYDANIAGLLTIVDDPDFQSNINKTYFNLGAGVYFNSDKFYVGLSVPSFIPQPHLDSTDTEDLWARESNMFLTGGYVFDLSSKWRFKPAFLAKYISGEPVSFDLTANFLYNNFVEFGAGYRFEDAISGLVNFRISEVVRLGYAYDYTTSDFRDYVGSTHELFLLFNIDTSTKGYDKSPRFF
ncbi:PorP/SprF family type IX secretion system membrane protein [Aureivirga marina]|uniref:PorP/SprF family type IX secretion system membrane protein n=1 Tax=Aureivirga marina TaxID=1182451 RepID=UPI0018CB1A50|nr:type IX secretion system membrane protein PorP/SprF [Aureivirga marina]